MSKLNKLYFGSVNPPIYQASTILFENISELESSERQYGRVGTETNTALEREIARIENAERSVIVESGLAAITNVLLSFLQKGDH
ncbi:MAG: PLP-dependent transferase, partial [Rickettsiales bacterium]|nr:PLP-dependent transferase [Rickettsiales bacterium]